MFNLYFNVNAEGNCGDGVSQVSENSDATGVYQLAAKMHEDYPQATIELEIVLVKNNEVFYFDADGTENPSGGCNLTRTVLLYKPRLSRRRTRWVTMVMRLATKIRSMQ